MKRNLKIFRHRAGNLVYNAVLPVISRDFRELPEINDNLEFEGEAGKAPVPSPDAACWAPNLARPKQ
jgi:hypothetical protein